MSETIIDPPTERLTVDVLTISQQEALLEAIRERRLAPLRIYEALQEAKKQASDDKALVKLGKLEAKFQKKLAAIDKAMTEAEGMIRDAKALLLEVGV